VSSRKIAAEAIGTALLLAAVVGSGIMAERLAGGNVALALLANALSTGAMLIVLVLVFGPVSGAHFNPAVSLVFAIRRELPLGQLVQYVLAQMVGAIIGVMCAHAMFEQSVLQVSGTARSGPAQWLSEWVATFGLIGTILGVSKGRPGVAAYAVGLYISAAYWFTSSTSFANPAATIARSLSDSFAGIRPIDVPPFVVAEVVSAVFAAVFFSWLFAPVEESRPPH
jgi:glycerol uptake facilitator-like aquaporin